MSCTTTASRPCTETAVAKFHGERDNPPSGLENTKQLTPVGRAVRVVQPQPEPALSKHLRQLTEAGLVEARRQGYYVLYNLVRDRVAPLSASLLAYLDIPSQPH